MTPSIRAENLINELCISSANEIDIEAIAFDSGVDVIYERLIGCEATLVGFGSIAIATINPSPSRGRERFSVAHEVGHWLMHRGKSFRCRVDDITQNFEADIRLEKEADLFASHLLMPTSIFQPAITAVNRPGLRELQEIANHFDVSLQAISIRLPLQDTLPVIVACYNKVGLKWALRSPHIPKRWWLHQKLDDDSFAYDLLYSGKECPRLAKQPAEIWFENDDADQYELLEQCMTSANGNVLVLLYLNDLEMFNLD